MIVLSSDQAIKDLLDKRSGIYSSRPEMYLGQIVSGGLRVLLMVRCLLQTLGVGDPLKCRRSMATHGE
jgi:hypothetical protein